MSAIEKTQVSFYIENGNIVVAFSRLVGRQFLTPERAREVGELLIQLATLAEAQREHLLN